MALRVSRAGTFADFVVPFLVCLPFFPCHPGIPWFTAFLSRILAGSSEVSSRSFQTSFGAWALRGAALDFQGGARHNREEEIRTSIHAAFQPL